MTAAAEPRSVPRPVTAVEDTIALNDIFAALSDPTRRAIIARLTDSPCTVTQLGEPFPVSAPAISKHLAVLERCGLIVRWKIGRVHYCRLVADPLARAREWIEQHQAFWERQLDALADYLDRDEDTCHPPPSKAQE
jgi:DNA-binding transcriptional ArsR family regulator